MIRRLREGVLVDEFMWHEVVTLLKTVDKALDCSQDCYELVDALSPHAPTLRKLLERIDAP